MVDVLGLIRTRAMKTGSELGYIGVSSTRIDILAHLADLTGVRWIVVNREYKRLGCGEHCQEPHLHVSSTTGRWSLTGVRALVFLSAIEPYLVIQRGVASDAIGAGRIAPAKPAVRQKMYDLGWPEMV